MSNTFTQPDADFGKIRHLQEGDGWIALYAQPTPPYVTFLSVVAWMLASREGRDQVVGVVAGEYATPMIAHRVPDLHLLRFLRVADWSQEQRALMVEEAKRVGIEWATRREMQRGAREEAPEDDNTDTDGSGGGGAAQRPGAQSGGGDAERHG